MSSAQQASAAGAQWLSRMRWGALAIQAAAIWIASELLDVELPLVPMWSLVALGAASNLWLGSRKEEAGHLGAFLVLDVALLSGLLYFSGGPTNPFSIIYVVYIAMSAVMLSPKWTWTIAALSILSFGTLFVVHVPSEHLGHAGHGGGFQTHLYGMFIALVMAVALITYFVSQLSLELRRRERALAESERLFNWMDSELQENKWLAADHATIADVAMYSYIALGNEGDLDLSAYPEIKRWLADVEGLDNFLPPVRSK